MGEVYHTRSIPYASSKKWEVMENEANKWCKYHKAKGQYKNNCHQLKKEIYFLIQKGHLVRYVHRDLITRGKGRWNMNEIFPESSTKKEK